MCNMNMTLGSVFSITQMQTNKLGEAILCVASCYFLIQLSQFSFCFKISEQWNRLHNDIFIHNLSFVPIPHILSSSSCPNCAFIPSISLYTFMLHAFLLHFLLPQNHFLFSWYANKIHGRQLYTDPPTHTTTQCMFISKLKSRTHGVFDFLNLYYLT